MHYELYLEALFKDAYPEITEENYKQGYDDDSVEESSLSDVCPLQDEDDNNERIDQHDEEDDISSVGSCYIESDNVPQSYLSLVGKHAHRYATIRYRCADEPLTYKLLFQLLYVLRSTNCMSWNPESAGVVTFHKAPGNMAPQLMELEDQVSLLLATQPNLWKGFMAFMDALPENEENVLMEAHNAYNCCFETGDDYYSQPDFYVTLGHGQSDEQ